VNHGYLKVIELIHENLIPALDRCSIVVSRLRGLAKYYESTSVFNAPVEGFTSVMGVIDILRLLAYTSFNYATEERRQFAIFSKWLRHEIDVQVTDPTSASADETTEQDLGLDYSQLLAYIQGAMTESKLVPFVSKRTAETSMKGGIEYEEVRTSIEQHKKGLPCTEECLSQHAALQDLEKRCAHLFHNITKWQVANTSMTCGLVLEDQKSTARDMRVVSEVSELFATLYHHCDKFDADLCEQSSAHLQMSQHMWLS